MWVRGLKRDTTLAGATPEVAPYVGAWIETCCNLFSHCCVFVAPYVGAWIETYAVRATFESLKSHPMWVRGLKLSCSSYDRVKQKVAPYVGAWIETTRTLKLNQSHLGRTLCGCVD